jgi:hypothetical protein
LTEGSDVSASLKILGLMAARDVSLKLLSSDCPCLGRPITFEVTRAKRLEAVSREQRHAMVHLLTRVVGVGIEGADMLVLEVFSRLHT